MKQNLFYNYIASLLFFITLNLSVPAQQFGTLRGFVADSSNGEVLPFCNILIEEINKGGATDINGFFHIPSVPAGQEYSVIISYVGYKTEIFK